MLSIFKLIRNLIITIGVCVSMVTNASHWVDISESKDQSMIIDFDTITVLPNPKRVVYQYKSINQYEYTVNAVILCDSAQSYFESVSMSKLDGTFISRISEETSHQNLMNNSFGYFLYERHCPK